MKQITNILEGIYNNLELRKKCIPLFISNAGIGKTTIVHQFAKNKNVNCLTVIASTKMPHEFAGISIPNHETKRMTYFDYDALLDLKDGDILFLDELLNTNQMILNAFLTVLEDRVLPSGKKLADIMIVAAANPHGATQLTPQIKERFIWYDIKFDKYSWKEYMSKYQITDQISEGLVTLIQNENFISKENNYMTPRSIEKAVNMILNKIETPYQNKLVPILKNFIENNTGNDIQHGDFIFKANEKISWLDLQYKLKKTK